MAAWLILRSAMASPVAREGLSPELGTLVPVLAPIAARYHGSSTAV